VSGAEEVEVQQISDAYDELASIYDDQEALLAATPMDLAALIEAGRRGRELLRRIGMRPRLGPMAAERWRELAARADILRRRGAELAAQAATIAASRREQAGRIGRGGGRLQAYASSERAAPARFIDQDR